jgi:hypothetical protein
VTGAGNTVEGALRDISMKPRRLVFDVDEAVVLAGNDHDRHIEFGISPTGRKGVRDLRQT